MEAPPPAPVRALRSKELEALLRVCKAAHHNKKRGYNKPRASAAAAAVHGHNVQRVRRQERVQVRAQTEDLGERRDLSLGHPAPHNTPQKRLRRVLYLLCRAPGCG